MGNLFGSLFGNPQPGAMASLFSGGFVGMSEQGLEDLKSGLNDYIKAAQGIADGFNEDGDISHAFRGEIQEAAKEYIKAVKEYIKAWVAAMSSETAHIDEAYANFKAAGTQSSTKTQNEADELRQNAANITLD